jgi:hypothetical protein
MPAGAEVARRFAFEEDGGFTTATLLMAAEAGP